MCNQRIQRRVRANCKGRPQVTTDFFQPSAFAPHEQLLSVYYRVSVTDDKVNLENIEVLERGKKVYGLPLNQLNADIFTFPVDKYVSDILARLI